MKKTIISILMLSVVIMSVSCKKNRYSAEGNTVTDTNKVSDGAEAGFSGTAQAGLLITENNVLKGIKENNLKRLELPENIVSIADGAFLNSGIEEIVLNEGLRNIGRHAFRGSRISRINFPGSIEEIGEHAFEDCKELRYADLSETKTSILQQDCFRDCGIKDIRLPENLLKISSHAFSGTRNLLSVVLPSSVTEIECSAFMYSSLESIAIPENIAHIGNNAFYGCSNLKEMKCIGSATCSTGKAGIGVFEGCIRLESLKIPDSICELDGWTIIGCESLREITVGKNVRKIGDYGLVTNHPVRKIIFTSAAPPELGSNVFIIVDDATSIIVPSESADIYRERWHSYSKHINPFI